MILRVVVASDNLNKRTAVEAAFREIGYKYVRVSSVRVSSSVSEQPMTLEETLLGASNRALAARDAQPGADFWVGIEGGIHALSEDYFECARICVLHRRANGRVARVESGTIDFPVGSRLVEHMRQGMDLNQAVERVVGRKRIGDFEGYYGYLTDGLMPRERAYTDAVIVALKQFQHLELVDETTFWR